MNKMIDNEINILDEKKLNIMKIYILKLEQDNLKTREKTNDEMVETIRKIIYAIMVFTSDVS